MLNCCSLRRPDKLTRGRKAWFPTQEGGNNETQVRHISDFTSGGRDWLTEVICSYTWHPITPSAEYFLLPRNLCMFKNELYFDLNWIQRVQISSSHTDLRKISHKDMLWRHWQGHSGAIKDNFTCIYWSLYTLIGQNFDHRENSNVS